MRTHGTDSESPTSEPTAAHHCTVVHSFFSVRTILIYKPVRAYFSFIVARDFPVFTPSWLLFSLQTLDLSHPDGVL